MTKIADIVAVATAKSQALQTEIDTKTAEKAALDALIAETSALTQPTVDLFDALAGEGIPT